MGVKQPDEITSARLRALLDSDDDIHRYNNDEGNPVGLRKAGSSYVQTIPNGVVSVLNLQENSVPSVFFHPESNAVTFIYD